MFGINFGVSGVALASVTKQTAQNISSRGRSKPAMDTKTGSNVRFGFFIDSHFTFEKLMHY
jgi:hypothetical protein